MRIIWLLAVILLNPLTAKADMPASSIPVVVSGTVPDEATHAKLIARVRELYGQDKVVDQLVLGKVVMPPNWVEHLNRLLDPALHQISHGQLKVEGSEVSVRGEVANEAQRQQIASDMATRLNPTYTIHNGLHVAVQDQSLIDSALANRNIEFETGSANLTPAGKTILDAIAAAMIKLQDKHVDITGYTDDHGLRASNINLSQARADAVKAYLVSRNVQAERINTYGVGPDRPIASNDTAEGRSRNRRIEFRVVQ
ncbi:MAG: OmpA family protein [Sulfuriferula sp.]|nr:OmpA family protein [Sulfuriferula sp.]